MAVNYERQKIKTIGSSLDDYSTPEDLIKQINEVRDFYKKNYNSEIIFEYDCNYSDVRYLCAYYRREETDLEMQIRIEREEKQDRWAKERDAKEFERLKKIFEN